MREPNVMVSFQGFGGLELKADTFGAPEDPAVLLLHGAAQSRHAWREAAAALAAAGRYVVTLDLRGHGDSAWAGPGGYTFDAYVGDLRAVLAQLPTRPVVVGSTLGGLIALGCVLGGGESLMSGIVLVDCAPWLNPSGQAELAERMRRHYAGFDSVEQAREAAKDFSPNRPTPALDRIESQLRRSEDGRLYWRWDPRAVEGFELDKVAALGTALDRIPTPTLVIRGRENTIITEAEIARFRAAAPAAEFVDIEGAGHLVASERFEMFNAALVDFLERRAPRAPLSFESGSDTRTLRDALGLFTSGVIIAAALDPSGKPQGLTANSFTSVSLDPPLILFCIAKGARSLEAFQHSDVFGASVLHIGQQLTSNTFASKVEDRFGLVQWETWERGAPIISGSLASFECERYGWHDGGDHIIVVGKVLSARYEPRRDPLLYFRGKYRRLHLA